MTNSIFLTVKKMLGIAEEYHAFDLDIIVNINSVFLNLNQLGVGPIDPYQITGEEETWDDFQGDTVIPGIQTYVYLKTRLFFDPPTNSFLVDNIQKQIAELEWRMNAQSETPIASLIPPTTDSSTPSIPPTTEGEVEQAFGIQTASPLAAKFHQKILSTINLKSAAKGG